MLVLSPLSPLSHVPEEARAVLDPLELESEEVSHLM